MEPVDLNTIPSSIQWHEGMLIGPHHFQQSSLRQEGLLRYHLKNLAPYYWGIQEFEIDKSLLVSGIFQVSKLQAVLPDGLEVRFESGNENKLEIDLTDYKDEIVKKDLTVFLAVPVQKVDYAVNRGELSRFRSIKGDLINDYNTGDNPVLIPRLIPALGLLVVDELSSKHVGFPLARITYKDANFSLTDYIPPGVSLSALPQIEEFGKSVVQQLREKANFLSEKIQSTSAATGMAMVLETKDTIRSVVSSLPYLETVLRSPELHPLSLYQALSLTVGYLASLDQSFIPPILEPYDHNNLLGIFTTVHDYIIRITEQGIQEKYTCFSFSYDSDECSFKITLEENWLGQNLIIGVRGQPGMSVSEVEGWLDKCVVGSESVLPSMRERRISGVKRHAIEGNENLIPLRGVQLFTLAVDSEFILPNEKLCIVNPANQVAGTMRADEIVLYVDNDVVNDKDESLSDSDSEEG
ncbi:MAG: type VI secretion system baseplate subunit TssK [Proteobacteria bacterium]|nr:type VI secretion system baseplate subunit TssK [Pseudomonadota bacterium]